MVFAKSSWYPEFFRAAMKTLFFNMYDTTPIGDYPLIADIIPSNSDKETYAGLGTIPKLTKFTDERKVQGFGDKWTYDIWNEKYELTLGVRRDEIEDEKYGQILKKISGMASEVRRAYDDYVFTHLHNGGTNTCFDGVAYFATTHNNGYGNQSNSLTTAFSKAAVQTACNTMRRYCDDKGRIIGMNPNMLVVSPELWWTAMETLNATNYVVSKPITADSTGALAPSNVNSLQAAGLQLVQSPYLTTSTEWYLMDTTKSVKPVILQTRTQPEFTSLDSPDSPEAFMRDIYMYGVRVRFGLGYGNWMTCIRGNA